jgi:hypothetical protein
MGEQAATLSRPADAAAPARPRRRRGVSIALALLIVAFAAGGVAVRQLVFEYDPITRGNSSTDVSPGAGNAMVNFPGYQAMLITAVAGKEFQLKWNIRNEGGRAVRVTGVPNGVSPYYVERVRLETGDDSDNERTGGSERELVPFRPFDLPPGETRMLALTYRFRDCPFPAFNADYARPGRDGRTVVSAGGGGSMSWTDQRIDYEVWGVGRNVVVGLPWTVVLVNAVGVCDSAQGR